MGTRKKQLKSVAQRVEELNVSAILISTIISILCSIFESINNSDFFTKASVINYLDN